MQKDLNEKRLCKTRPVFSAILNVVTWQANLVGFQDSSIIRCHKRMKIDCVRSCCSKTGEKNAIKTIKIHLSTAEKYLHQVNIMLLELDLRMLLYFFRKTIRYIVKIMFELLYILQNWSFSPNCPIMQFLRWLCDRMRQEVNCAKSHQRIISESLCSWFSPYILLNLTELRMFLIQPIHFFKIGWAWGCS